MQCFLRIGQFPPGWKWTFGCFFGIILGININFMTDKEQKINVLEAGVVRNDKELKVAAIFLNGIKSLKEEKIARKGRSDISCDILNNLIS